MHESLIFAYWCAFVYTKPSIHLTFQSKLLKQIKKFQMSNGTLMGAFVGIYQRDKVFKGKKRNENAEFAENLGRIDVFTTKLLPFSIIIIIITNQNYELLRCSNMKIRLHPPSDYFN